MYPGQTVFIDEKGKRWYRNPKRIVYYSKRYDKTVIVEEGTLSNGADFARDIYSNGWFIHDQLCNTGKFEDGTPCNNWQASTILSDVLRSERRFLLAPLWWFFTWLLGCKKARENGMF